MADRKDRMALLSRYDKLHLVRYESKPSFNKNIEQWAADALIESYGLPQCYDILDYYFNTSPSPNWKSFYQQADKFLSAMMEKQKDLEERKQRREKARAWLNE